MIPLRAAKCIVVAAAAATLFHVVPRTPFAAGDRALGEYLSSECVTCHQITGKYEGIPPIVGWPEDTFVEIMDEYRNKKRHNPVMQTIAGRFSKAEIAALAAFFGSVKSKN